MTTADLPQPPPRYDLGPPRADVSPVGRWTWRVVIRQGFAAYGPYWGYGWVILGHRRAHRKAARELRRHLDRQHRRDQVESVHVDDVHVDDPWS